MHFPAVELLKAIQDSTYSRMSGFLWHSSKWTNQFEVLACSLNTNLKYVPTMLQLHPSLIIK